MPAATAAAEPLEEVPVDFERSCGLRVRPGSCTPNSAVTVLPSTAPPARRALKTARASLPGVKPAQTSLPIVVGRYCVLKTSLTPNGTPCSGPG